MNTFKTILLNNFKRMNERTGEVVLIIVFTLGAMFLAVFVSKSTTKPHIAYIGTKAEITEIENSNNFKISFLEKTPPLSDLIKQKYCASVTKTKNGEFQIQTLLSDNFKTSLLAMLENPKIVNNNKSFNSNRKIGSNLIGFTMMFILMFSFWLLSLFASDKESGILTKISTTPTSFLSYLLAHTVFAFTIIILVLLSLVILRTVGFNIGFTLFEYLLFFIIECFLGVSFALLLFTIMDKSDNANMLGSAIVVSTTVLAGGFFDLKTNSKIFDSIINFLPQKQLLLASELLENGNRIQAVKKLSIVFIFSLVLFLIVVNILKNKFVKSN